jgi:hypothetical protein
MPLWLEEPAGEQEMAELFLLLEETPMILETVGQYPSLLVWAGQFLELVVHCYSAVGNIKAQV